LQLDAGGGDVIGTSVAFSPDGRTLATAGLDPFVHVWDVGTGTLIREFEQNVGGVLTLDFGPDGSILAASGYGQPFASLWDVATGAQVGPRLTAGSRSAMVDLSSDGRYLLQTYGSGEGAVWDIDSARWAQRACGLANRTLTREEWSEFLPGRSYEPACVS
jgi:WD40 repeat protein